MTARRATTTSRDLLYMAMKKRRSPMWIEYEGGKGGVLYRRRGEGGLIGVLAPTLASSGQKAKTRPRQRARHKSVALSASLRTESR
jgi:hypothetical protein